MSSHFDLSEHDLFLNICLRYFLKSVSLAVTVMQRNISKMTFVVEFISILWPCKRACHHFMKKLCKTKLLKPTVSVHLITVLLI